MFGVLRHKYVLTMVAGLSLIVTFTSSRTELLCRYE
jgi:hypothetical protein